MANNNNPKIGYLLKTFPKLSETFILNEILELERQGINLHIFSLRKPQDEKHHAALQTLKADVTYIPSLFPRSSQDIVHLQEANVLLMQQNLQNYFQLLHLDHSTSEIESLNIFLQAGYLVKAIRETGICHLHAHFINIPTAVAEVAAQLCGIPYSITAHAKDIYLSKPEVLNRRISQAKFVLTCTKYNQQFLQKLSTSNTPIYLSYHGLDLAKFTPNIKQEIVKTLPTILSVGRFCEKKGFPHLIQACKLLKERNYKFQCLIVGYGPLQAEIEQLIAELKLEDCIFLVGKMTQDELIEMYRQADIFVLPCHITENGDRDGIPNVLLEAMAMKVPVISTNISGIVELIQHKINGILVPPKEPYTLAIELENLINNPQFRKVLSNQGRIQVSSNFSIEKNTIDLKNIFMSVLANEYSSKQPVLEAEVSLV
ncbi:glycosyltransferase [Gloeocapsopsis sp. IPPAS B-1203]|uniref:glycosyltransferase n=1 Tax=Gloeocapsopsis sp. IPPAS B-1203 TaxID=2049454 RepID=UPI000C194C25|nr:glycosyltransferase [Gloeocapsopsis sp. IPPAS B-1203]PIG94786.1 colanic acid biosynthesis glycosyltransferase WcaL [Gloeocapsopsis sp. IPPAS B-1203]